jgi:NAD(P)H-hydrate epimerase
MSGAIALAGMATLRGGAGLVTLAVPDRCLETVAGFDACFMTVPLPSDPAGLLAAAAEGVLQELIERFTVVACGPGLGRSRPITALVRTLYTGVRLPMVLDADALNALAAHDDGLSGAGGPRIITPHPGEFQRLAGVAADDRTGQEARAVELAGQQRIVLVLKGHHTLVTDGRRSAHNTTGNPGMASGGTGDVLTGILTALLCQGLGPWDAARLGVYLHGLAGDIAARELTQQALTAGDVVRFLPQAWRELGY